MQKGDIFQCLLHLNKLNLNRCHEFYRNGHLSFKATAAKTYWRGIQEGELQKAYLIMTTFLYFLYVYYIFHLSLTKQNSGIVFSISKKAPGT